MVDQSTNLIKQTKTHKALISNLINSHLVQIIKSPSDLLEKIPQAIVSVEKNKKPKSETSVIALPTIKHEDLILFIKYPEELLKCSSRYFEELIAELLKNDGWDVQIVKRNNAPGPDIIAVSTKLIHDTPTKMIVECKRHSINNPVDVNVVRKVMYWVNEEFQATLGMIATTSKFTKVAIERAEKSHAWRLNMKDQSSIIDWLKRQHSN
jgi:restriction endonuclease Mrr